MLYNLTEEELHESHSWYPKAEQLVRLGLLPVTQLPYIKRALTAIHSDVFLPSIVRKPFYRFIDKMLKLGLEDPTIFRLIRNKVAIDRNKLAAKRAYIPEEREMDQLMEGKKEEAHEVYHDTYRGAVEHAHEHIKKRSGGLHFDERDHMYMPRKPTGGQTNRLKFQLHKDGKPTNKYAHVQVHNLDHPDRPGEHKKPFELNFHHDRGTPKVHESFADMLLDMGVELTEEQLTELSGATLSSYVKKATDQKSDADYNLGRLTHKRNQNQDYRIASDEKSKGGLGNFSSANKLLRKSEKRGLGIKTAVGKMLQKIKEEREMGQLDETSPEKAKAYMDARAKEDTTGHSKEKTRKRVKGFIHASIIRGSKIATDPKSGATHRDMDESFADMLLDMGVELTEEQLTELSKKTLGSYIKKAMKDGTERSFVSGIHFANRKGASGPLTSPKEFKRHRGITNAVHKLTKEDIADMLLDMGVELTEEQFQALEEGNKENKVKKNKFLRAVGSSVNSVGRGHKHNDPIKKSERDLKAGRAYSKSTGSGMGSRVGDAFPTRDPLHHTNKMKDKRWGDAAAKSRKDHAHLYAKNSPNNAAYESMNLGDMTLEEGKKTFKKLLRPNFYKDEKHKENDTQTAHIAAMAHSSAEVTEAKGPDPRYAPAKLDKFERFVPKKTKVQKEGFLNALSGADAKKPLGAKKPTDNKTGGNPANMPKTGTPAAKYGRTQKVYSANEEVNVSEDIDYRKTPLGMLQTLAAMVKSKKRHGGKVGPNDRQQATKARNEIRRRKYYGSLNADIGAYLETLGIELNEEQLNVLESRTRGHTGETSKIVGGHGDASRGGRLTTKSMRGGYGPRGSFMKHQTAKAERKDGKKQAEKELDESYQLRFNETLKEFGVENFSELDVTTAKEFLARVDTQLEERKVLSYAEIQAQKKSGPVSAAQAAFRAEKAKRGPNQETEKVLKDTASAIDSSKGSVDWLPPKKKKSRV